MIQNYVFDFGNVLARFAPDELTAVCVADPAVCPLIREVVFDRLYWDALDAGTITDEEVKAGFCSRLPEEWNAIACDVYDRWVDLCTPVEGMPQLVKDIKEKGGKLYLLSNISIYFAENYHRNPWIKELLDLFDGLVFSGPIGMTKPNREIYEHLLEKYRLSAEECIFIDDALCNIQGAETMGFQAYLFDGDVEKLRKVLGL